MITIPWLRAHFDFIQKNICSQSCLFYVYAFKSRSRTIDIVTWQYICAQYRDNGMRNQWKLKYMVVSVVHGENIKKKKTRNGFRHMNMIRSICYEFASRPRVNGTKLLVFTLHWASNIAEGNGVMLGMTRFNLCVLYSFWSRYEPFSDKRWIRYYNIQLFLRFLLIITLSFKGDIADGKIHWRF